MSNHRLQIGRPAKARLAALVGFLGAMVVSASGCRKQSEATTGQANTDYASVRQQVVRRVEAGEIKPDVTGKANLPAEFQSASMNGQVWAGENADAGWLVGFPIGNWKTVDLLLYAEKPVMEGKKTLQMGATELTLARHVGGKWYEAYANAPPQ